MSKPMTYYRNKYGAVKCEFNGHKFDSKKERDRYIVLESMVASGHINDLELHPRFDLNVNGHKIGRYTADFRYSNADGSVVVEDVKSKATKTRDYILRKKILATYNPPINITET